MFKRDAGFTLIELVMVIVVIMVLVSIAMPEYLKSTDKARNAQAMFILDSLYKAVRSYYDLNGVWPPDQTWNPQDTQAADVNAYIVNNNLPPVEFPSTAFRYHNVDLYDGDPSVCANPATQADCTIEISKKPYSLTLLRVVSKNLITGEVINYN